MHTTLPHAVSHIIRREKKVLKPHILWRFDQQENTSLCICQ